MSMITRLRGRLRYSLAWWIGVKMLPFPRKRKYVNSFTIIMPKTYLGRRIHWPKPINAAIELR